MVKISNQYNFISILVQVIYRLLLICSSIPNLLGYADGAIPKTSYTREYVRNLPPTTQLGTVRSSAPPVTSRASKIARSSSSHGNLNSASIAQNSAGEYGEHCSSYSSSHSSSDKSDPPAPPYNVIPGRGRMSVRNGSRVSRHNSSSDVRDNTPISSDEPFVYEEKSKINSQTFRCVSVPLILLNIR